MNITAIASINFLVFPLVEVFTVTELSIPLPPELWTLLTVGVGGYTIGRLAEKVAGNLKK